ncbi:MAG: serine/threonine protein kinase, partial [Dactylosporangium sp.]|nr:serine/threonine protein kinase [Dactylosporangium sp.]NNJ63194.1 serine/threonine protein kinase [Dactylosporangium sp.]
MSSSSTLIAQRYRLIRQLGSGGMGRVWLAQDVKLDRQVAVKEIIPPKGLTERERTEIQLRTLREARTAASLSHPNVVRVFDTMNIDDQPWIVMEYVPSRSLQEVIDTDGPLPSVRVAEIGMAVLAALRTAHKAGVLHRDVKPGNVLLADDGRVVLTDFGLATFDGDPQVTRTGLILGSPQYISPERATEGTSLPESDLWSFGATLYAAVEGRAPYARANALATLTALVTEDLDPAPNAGRLQPVLDALLRRDPAARLSPAAVERLLRRAVPKVPPQPGP